MSGAITDLKRNLYSVSANYALEFLSKENIAIIENFNGAPDVEATVKIWSGEILKRVAACKAELGNIERYLSLKEKFSELLMLVKLASLHPTHAIPETTTPTPDFKVRFGGNEFFIEMKSLNVMATQENHQTIMENALAAKIELEEQRKSGRDHGHAVTVIQPYRRGKDYRHDSTSMVVESLIDKVDQNISSAQFEFGPTILLLDLSEQLLLHGSGLDNLKKEYLSGDTKTLSSGELWYLAFGQAGMAMKRVVDFDGAPNADSPLSKNGVFSKYPFVRGIIVHYSDQFYGMTTRTRENIPLVSFLEDVCVDVAIE